MGSYKKIMKALNGGDVSSLCPTYLFNSQTLKVYLEIPLSLRCHSSTFPFQLDKSLRLNVSMHILHAYCSLYISEGVHMEISSNNQELR